ncbi:hypothetical protein [Aureibacter tunicatorum]|uniref:Uncharacterized protein n=1 Tax=Aureibacter tunicatorum TaxID=866807 RepID=A0AAE3XPH4_9BACT|nr:hypothetical protein [Aureibacter tunicatorum]MDR6239723.1 hypothetical protein [Aureibacter tunicatorum]BDD04199.1 hypothetical protein AUTU_16820 [Aureibacter tunicatorum]
MQENRFLIAENPLAGINANTYLIHNEDPFIMAQAFVLDKEDKDTIEELSQAFEFNQEISYGDEHIFLGIEFMAMENIEENQELINQILTDMIDWYCEVLDAQN